MLCSYELEILSMHNFVKLSKNFRKNRQFQGGHGGFTQIPYTVPYTTHPPKILYNTVHFQKKYRTHRTFSGTCTVHTKKILLYLYRTHTKKI